MNKRTRTLYQQSVCLSVYLSQSAWHFFLLSEKEMCDLEGWRHLLDVIDSSPMIHRWNPYIDRLAVWLMPELSTLLW